MRHIALALDTLAEMMDVAQYVLPAVTFLGTALAFVAGGL